MPLFSIVIPAYNREREIRRALESCLRQTYADYEVVVVDDASCDRTAEEALSYADPRIRLLRHAENRGFCPARNTGALAAAGEWVIFLDSDDELLPEALASIAARVAQTPADIAQLFFMLRYDDGHQSPEPAFTGELFDLPRYLHWHATVQQRSDFIQCARIATFHDVQFPPTHAFEWPYFLDYFARYTARGCPELVVLVHQDAAERASAPAPAWMLDHAAENAAALDAMLVRHGRQLRHVAPAFYIKFLRTTAQWFFLAGCRARAFPYICRFLAHRPLSLAGWATLLGGSVGKTPLLKVIAAHGTPVARPPHEEEPV